MNEYSKMFIKSVILGIGLILGVFAVILILAFIDDLTSQQHQLGNG